MEQVINIEEAVYFLMWTERHEVKTKLHTEVKWVREGKEVASGGFDATGGTVTVTIDERNQIFMGYDTKRLRNLGAVKKERNKKVS